MDLLTEELSLAIFSCIQAAKVVSEIYNAPFSVKWKAKDDPLTEADLQANKIISDFIQTKYPDDGFLSEEAVDDLTRLKKQRIWILDPIDGTREFVDKNPEFSISLGLSLNGKATLGVVLNPITRELFYGDIEKGIGYLLLDEEFNFDYDNIRLEKPFFISKEFSKPTILVSRSELLKSKLFDRDEFWKNEFTIFPVGSIAYKLALISVGKAHFTISLKPKSEWDICAGVALVNAAGGVCSDIVEQKEFIFNKEKPFDQGILAGNKDFILDFLKDKSIFLKNSFVDTKER